MHHKLLATVVCAVALGTAATGANASTDRSPLAKVKQATAEYRNLTVAEAAGYNLLTDANGIACIDMPGMGAMGVHYVNGTLVGDATIDPLQPEALVYQQDESGHSHLVAVEYVVFQSAWDAQHTSPPALFGQTFNVTPSPNRYGLPAFYSLHAWIWKHNPAGTFAMWNPRVSCTPESDHADRR